MLKQAKKKRTTTTHQGGFVDLKPFSFSEIQDTGPGISRNEAGTKLNHKKPCVPRLGYVSPVFEERVQLLYKKFEGYCHRQQ